MTNLNSRIADITHEIETTIVDAAERRQYDKVADLICDQGKITHANPKVRHVMAFSYGLDGDALAQAVRNALHGLANAALSGDDMEDDNASCFFYELGKAFELLDCVGSDQALCQLLHMGDLAELVELFEFAPVEPAPFEQI
jgi:hypothetical protein